MYVCSIDMEAAFDTATPHHAARSLSAVGFLAACIASILECVENGAVAAMREGMSKFVEKVRGVRQGGCESRVLWKDLLQFILQPLVQR